MASTGKKEYSVKINGIAKEITNVTKLADVLDRLDEAAKKVNTTNAAGAAPSKAKAKAWTDEEKAILKLIATEDKLRAVTSDTNKAQIAANIALREQTREVTRQIQIATLAEGSVKQMGMTLTDLRNEYEELSLAERVNVEVGGLLLEQIQALDKDYKKIRESTGNFRDSVGNYEKALTGLEQLKEGLDGVADSSANLAADAVGSSEVLDAFGGAAETAAEGAANLTGVTTVLMQAQSVYIQVVKERIVQETIGNVIDKVKLVQLRAKTIAENLSTKSTILATIAQKAFNLVAAANPYVLLAIAILAVGAALFAFASNSDDAAEKQKKLNDQQNAYLDSLAEESRRVKEVADSRIDNLNRQLKVLEAQKNKTNELRAVEDKILQERINANNRQKGFYAEELTNLEKNRKKLNDYRDVLLKIQKMQAEGKTRINFDVDLDGKADRATIEKAIEHIQGKVDVLDRKVEIGTSLKVEAANLQTELIALQVARRVADAATAKENLKKAKDLAKEKAALELAALRAAEDARLRLLENTYAQERKVTTVQFNRQIEDIRIRLANETKLTAKARAALNDTIVSLEKEKNKELKALAEEQARKELETVRQLEDARTAIELGQRDRRALEINQRYDREIQDLQKRLQLDKSLTVTQQNAINDIIIAAQVARSQELQTLTAQDLERRNTLELSAIDAQLQKVRDKVGNATARGTDGLKLIDVDKTKANFAEIRSALDTYIDNLKDYQSDLTTAHQATLLTLKEGTPEYEEELQKYAAANEDVARRIKEAQKEEVANTKESTESITNYYKDLFGKISEYAANGVGVINSVLETVNAGIQAQLDNLNASLENTTEKYEEAKKQREDAVENVEEIETQLQNATGGTSEALQQQLQDAMRARNEADREEKRLAKEKEKREAEIAKKEKQLRRTQLIAGIASGIANTAQGVTKALGDWVFPLNLVIAGIVGAAGLLQVGIMSKQLSKLADGGLLEGPSHAGGGVPIGLGYEAEGGEFVVNKRSTARNMGLINLINDTDRTITAADVAAVLPSDNSQTPVTSIPRASDERLLQAIENINLTPVVAVTDIIDATNQVVGVRDMAGF